MPKIDSLRQGQRIETGSPVPIDSTGDARIPGEAISTLGRGIQNAAAAISDYEQRRARAEKAVRMKEKQYEIDKTIFSTKMKVTQEGAEDGSDLRPMFAKEATKPLQEVVKNERDPEVRNALMQYARDASMAADQSLFAESVRRGGVALDKRAGALLDEARKRVQDDPTVAPQELAGLNQVYDQLNDLYPGHNLSKVKMEARARVAESVFEGYAAQKKYGVGLKLLQANKTAPDVEMDPEQAVNLGIIGEAEASQLSARGEKVKVPAYMGNPAEAQGLEGVANALSPEQRDRYRQQFQNAIKERDSIKLSDLNDMMSDVTYSALSGNRPDAKVVERLRTNIRANENLSPEAKKRALDTLNSSLETGKSLDVLRRTPRNQWADLVSKDEPGDVFNAAVRGKHKEALLRSAKQIAEAQDKDAAGYVYETFQDELEPLRLQAADGDPGATNRYIRMSLAKQDALGIPKNKQRVLPKAMASQIAEEVKNTTNGADAAFVMEKYQRQYGANFSRVFSEIAADEKLPADFMVASYMQDPDTKARIIDNIRQKKPLEEAFKNSGRGTEKNILEKIVAQKTADYRAAINESVSDGSRTQFANALQNQVLLESMKNRESGMDPETAVNKARKSILEQNFVVSTGGRSKVLVPRVVGKGVAADPETINAFISTYSKAENFKDLGIATPGEGKKTEFSITLGRDVLGDEDVAMKNLELKGKWVTNSAQDGIQLMFQDERGLMPVRDKQGKIIEKKYVDIILKPDAKTRESMKSRYQKFKDMVFGDE